jgi:PAS domain S-box-containing protein
MKTAGRVAGGPVRKQEGNMIDSKKYDAELRKMAEALAREQTSQFPESLKKLTPEETQRTLHELRVHQIELELQNEELRAAQSEIDAARARYFNLYDLAPVGYCTISEEGMILEANLSVASLLEVFRNTLINQLFSNFIFKEDQDLYYHHRNNLFGKNEPHYFDLRMLKKDGTVFWAHLVGNVSQIQDNKIDQVADGTSVCHVVLSDITERKKAEQAVQEKMDELERFHKLTVGRELTMIELKKEVNGLLKKMGQEEKYKIV